MQLLNTFRVQDHPKSKKIKFGLGLVSEDLKLPVILLRELLVTRYLEIFLSDLHDFPVVRLSVSHPSRKGHVLIPISKVRFRASILDSQNLQTGYFQTQNL